MGDEMRDEIFNALAEVCSGEKYSGRIDVTSSGELLGRLEEIAKYACDTNGGKPPEGMVLYVKHTKGDEYRIVFYMQNDQQ
tara:strand:+ start:669 stop:911 length:243 start_codon:yes stop_codon:yes gene_type:complete